MKINSHIDRFVMRTYSIQNELSPIFNVKHKKHIEENKGIPCPHHHGKRIQTD